MLALIASGAAVAYFLVPGTLYRILFSLFIPPKNFQRTRSDEVRFAVLAGLVPLGLAVFLVFAVAWIGHHPFAFPDDSLLSRRADYRAVFNGAYSEKLFESDPSRFWHALNHVLRRQARILFWYYLALILEATGLGLCSRRLWRFESKIKAGAGRRRRLARWFADHVLVPQISEWYLLLSTAAFAPKVARRVHVDVLLGDDLLYRGVVAKSSYFLDKDGSLSGIMLTNADRFDRRRYLNDEAADKHPQAENYWKPIRGAKLYLSYDKVTNLNIRYEPTAPDFLTRIVEQLLLNRGMTASVTLQKPSE